MRTVKINELTEGDVLAEYLINEQGQILLQPGAIISQKLLSVLVAWNVEEIRIRDPKNTDEEVEQAMLTDAQANKTRACFGGKTIFSA